MKNTTILNCLLVETPKRDRTFFLQHGDLWDVQVDLFIMNRYGNKESMLFTQMQQKLSSFKERIFFYGKNGITISIVEQQDLSQMILIVDVPFMEFEAISIRQYEQLIHQIFAGFHALEQLGQSFYSIALPVFYRNGIEQVHDKAIETLLLQSVYCLKKSMHVHSIHCVLYHQKDAHEWSSQMNKVLGRHAYSIDQFSDIELYRRNVVMMLQKMNRNVEGYFDTIQPLMQAVNSTNLQLETISAFSRKLLELYCMKLLQTYNEPFQNLDAALTLLKNNYSLNALTIQNFYQIKGFGNVAVHRLNKTYIYDNYDLEDITILLICLAELIHLYANLQKELIIP